MASLANQTISSTYDGLIKTSSDNAVPVSGVQALEDGSGNALALSVGRSGNGVSVSGNLAVDTNTLYVDAASNEVGIGTSDPDARFSVVSASANSSAAKIGGLEYGGTQRGLTIKTFQSGGGDDCGVEFNAAEGLAGYGSFVFKADTAERMRIDSSGNVGIGEQNPTVKLDVAGDGTGFYAGGGIRIKDVNATGNSVAMGHYSHLIGGGGSANAALVNTGAGFFSFHTNGSEAMRIDSSGNITQTASGNPQFTISGSAGAYTGILQINGAGGGGSKIQTSGGTNSLAIETNGSEAMRIDSSGNVGIGTVPKSWATAGGTKALQISTRGAISEAYDNVFLSNNYYFDGSERYIETNVAARLGCNSTGNIIFENAPSGTAGSVITFEERMRIDSSGNVIAKAGTIQVNRSDTQTQYGIFGQDSSGGYISWQRPSPSVYENFRFIATNQSGSVERMRITSTGYTKMSNDGSYYYPTYNFHEFNNTANGNEVGVFVHKGTSTPYGVQVRFVGAAPNNTTNYFYNGVDSGATRYIVYSNGNVVNTNGSYGAISDAKLKENIVDASPKLYDLMQVKVRNYNLIGEDKKQLGVVAQELEEVFPSMIDESPDFEEQEVIDEEGNVTKQKVDLGTTTKSVKYSVFVPMLIKAIQEQQEIINDLKARIETLEAK